MKLEELRKEYRKSGLRRADLHEDPFVQFERWFEQAVAAELTEPNAMSLATVSHDGEPSLRTVLLKFFDRGGFVFFTNHGSKKARQIEENPKVALLFPWLALERQLTIVGTAAKISTAQSMRYFASRPRGSQLGAWVSQQSTVISSRALLDMKLQEMRRRFRDGEVPLPSFWGGYRVVPRTFEFWQGRANRLHDRFLYTLDEGGSWSIERLAP